MREKKGELHVIYLSTLPPYPGGHVGVGKQFMQLRGLNLGPPRLPLLPLPPDQAKALETSLRDIGFFDWT